MEKNRIPIMPHKKAAMHVSVSVSLSIFFLSLFKLIAGIIARSDAMISDAVHSASDA